MQTDNDEMGDTWTYNFYFFSLSLSLSLCLSLSLFLSKAENIVWRSKKRVFFFSHWFCEKVWFDLESQREKKLFIGQKNQ